MKNIKKFYKEHRIFIILMTIVLVCAILIITVLIQCFYIGNGKDKYGNRLEGIENYKISEARQSDFKNNTANNDQIDSVDMMITGKIIYLTFQFEKSTDLETAKELANSSLKEFSDEEKDFYDIMITMKKNSSEEIEGFLISGAKNATRPTIVWNNNRHVEHTTDSDTEEDNS